MGGPPHMPPALPPGLVFPPNYTPSATVAAAAAAAGQYLTVRVFLNKDTRERLAFETISRLVLIPGTDFEKKGFEQTSKY